MIEEIIITVKIPNSGESITIRYVGKFDSISLWTLNSEPEHVWVSRMISA